MQRVGERLVVRSWRSPHLRVQRLCVVLFYFVTRSGATAAPLLALTIGANPLDPTQQPSQRT